ncbi:DHA2 family efflux MFS transporter permease subunit [Mycobacterium sp. shizuoka-1]|uniref:DHA2 family efflux MFS transporter permease subunit n=1 Tax=Mycobacterium sp. shizuoka-1 TaxID=2039281 RepID=UPI001E2B482A|nr:DHA2 family efflux MFS transporter permease subunit [Mycobacterium sp. shizuoka-1]
MTQSHPFRALWVLMIGLFLIVVDSTAVAVANPVLKNAFGVSYGDILWVSTSYLLAFAALLLVGGRLGDRFGPKGVYLLGLALFSASSLGCGTASSIDMLIAARVAQGVGAALLAPQIFTAVTRMFPPERRGRAMGVWGATTGVGLLAGPILGGVVLDGFGWQWIFLINVPIGLGGLALAMWLVPALPGRPLQLDLIGALLSAVGIGLVVFGLQQGRADWSPTIWTAMLAGLVAIAAFVVWQAVAPDEPLIPLRLIAHRNFVLSTAGIGLVSFAFVAFVVPLMIFLQDGRGLSPIGAALLSAPMALATVALAPAVGRLVDRVHPGPVVVFGFALLAAALLWLAMGMAPSTPVWRLVVPLTLVGVAGAFTWEPLAVIASRALPPDVAGAGSALCNTARQLGGALSTASVAALTAALLGDEWTRAALAAAMAQSMWLPLSAAALGALTALFFVSREPATAAAARVRRDMSVPL